eukprot:CAMPEP_0119009012 /NCGR_PEP_ID=MMETSP1176-20130426/4080_1 /TAXON_ID=265551 /ORGANISM="Synedropsis recta cf, Strain CCMP1620" /LENGTH=193 /DNA_ID=CAMNT_0006961439 /DNA_START=93 /DNA_END=674 /DNA_ORIENTATION=+
MTIAIKDFDNAEVCIWLNAMGLGSKIGPFKENDVDGDLLCSLSQEDLTGDLGLSNLQAKKIIRGVENFQGANDAPDTSHDSRIAELEAENEQLQSQVTSLKAKIESMQGSQTPAPAQTSPPPQQQQQQVPPPKKKQGPGVVGGAAVGAAGGAAKGAIAGAILPGMSASDGAKAGAAVGATKGGLRGIRNRRRG